MLCRGILSLALISAVFLGTNGEGLGSSVYFDVNLDLLPDTEHTMVFGDEVLMSVYLGGFTEETSSFQFDIFYDGGILKLVDYDTYIGQPDEDPGLTGITQTKAELGPWATSQWSAPVTQEVNEFDAGSSSMREFYMGGSFTETATGDGILTYLVFKATATGQTELDVEMPSGTWFLEDVSQQPAPINMTVYIIPEPSILVMILAAIPFLFMKCGRRT